jgi:cytochrome c556
VKTLVLFISAIAGAAGCQRPAATTAPQTSATAVLDAMDTRVPVPLLPMMANHQKQNMRDHLQAVQTIVAAAGAGDFPAIARAAATIGYSEQMGQMCSHMGAGAPGFTEQALRFHHTADRISDAARQRDMPGVLGALGNTLATCTGCHATFKQKLVDDTTWASLAGQAAPQHR